MLTVHSSPMGVRLEVLNDMDEFVCVRARLHVDRERERERERERKRKRGRRAEEGDGGGEEVARLIVSVGLLLCTRRRGCKIAHPTAWCAHVLVY